MGRYLLWFASTALLSTSAYAQNLSECQRRLSLHWDLKSDDELMSGKTLLVVFKGDRSRLREAQRAISELTIFAAHDVQPSRFGESAIIPLGKSQALLTATMQPFFFEREQTPPLTRRLCEIAVAYSVEPYGWSLLNGPVTVGSSFELNQDQR